MGPVAAAIAVVAKIAAAATIKGFLVRTALTIAASALMRALTPKPKAGGAANATGVEQQRQIGENTPRAIALGWTIVAGSEAALWASGDGDDNKFNTRVIAVSDWPCTLQKVWVDGRALTFEGDINTGWFACSQYRAKAGAARLWMRFVKGDWQQAVDADLVSYAAANGAWGSEDRLRGVSALLIRRQYDADAFPAGAPDNGTLRVEVKDAPVYDWRDVTQSLGNVRTWKPSENPVVLCENALCLLRAPAQFSPGSTAPLVGPGMDFARRPLAKLTAMANICDELVGGVPRYRAGGVVGADMTGRDIIARFAAACGGQWVSSGDGGYLRPGHVPTPTMEIPAGALSATESDSFDPWARPDATVNSLIGSYPDPSNAWEIVPLPPATDAAWVARDGGVRSGTEDLSFVPYREQAWRLVVRKVRAAQLQGTRQFTGPHWLVEVEPGDIVTAPDLGLPYASDTWWMVNSTTMMPRSDGVRAALSLSQIDAAIDDAPPVLGAPAAFTPRALSRALLAPALDVVQRVSSGGGGQQPEIVFTLPDASPQGLANVELRGPATSLAALPASGPRSTADLSRGLPYPFAAQPGFYQYRSRGRDATGALGLPSAWVDLAEVVSAVIVGGTSSVPSLPNMLPDAQYDRDGPNGSRQVLWQDIPALPVLSRFVDEANGVYSVVTSPPQAALVNGSNYGQVFTPSQNAVDAVPLPAGRIGYRMRVSAVPASGTLTATIDLFFMRLMGFREDTGAWDTSVDIPLDATNQFVQDISGFYDSTIRRRWTMALWYRVRAGVAVQVSATANNPAFYAMPPEQTVIPPWLPSSNAAPRATRNVNYPASPTAPTSPNDGDTWIDTSVNPNVLRSRIGGAWVASANNVSNTNQLTDGAGLGLTAAWTGTTGRPSNLSVLTGSEPIQNTFISVVAGQLTGIGTGNLTAVGNSLITVDGNGNIGGIGTGTGTTVSNNLVADGVNGVRDAQLSLGLQERGLLLDNAPAAAVLSTALDAGVGPILQMTTPADAALPNGSYYGAIQARALTGGPLNPANPNLGAGCRMLAGRVGFRQSVSLDANAANLTNVQRVWTRAYALRTSDGAYLGEYADSTDYTIGAGTQEKAWFADLAADRDWVLITWIQVKAGIAAPCLMNTWKPMIAQMRPGQTAVPIWRPGESNALGADVTVQQVRTIVPQFPSIEVKQGEAGHTGTRTITHVAQRGGVAITGGSWSLPAGGTDLGAATVTVNAASGVVSLSGIVQSGKYRIRYIHTDSVATDFDVNLAYASSPSAGVGGAIRARSTGNSGIASNTFSAIASVPMNAAPAGLTDFGLCDVSPLTQAGNNTSFQLRITRAGVATWTGTAFQGIDGAGALVNWVDAVGEMRVAVAAVAAGAATYAIEVRRTAGTGSISSTSTVIDITVTAT
jgi:Putative phage tail protein